ncbi:hypothetical protein WJX73_000455 [Symbiochloris irregularis]|uniref:Uncharacterized protein n=1 Tax=Symbiochloris irregularis TaxID=706552 RepID=A0AAW1NVT3_9CHLO
MLAQSPTDGASESQGTCDGAHAARPQPIRSASLRLSYKDQSYVFENISEERFQALLKFLCTDDWAGMVGVDLRLLQNQADSLESGNTSAPDQQQGVHQASPLAALKSNQRGQMRNPGNARRKRAKRADHGLTGLFSQGKTLLSSGSLPGRSLQDVVSVCHPLASPDSKSTVEASKDAATAQSLREDNLIRAAMRPRKGRRFSAGGAQSASQPPAIIVRQSSGQATVMEPKVQPARAPSDASTQPFIPAASLKSSRRPPVSAAPTHLSTTPRFFSISGEETTPPEQPAASLFNLSPVELTFDLAARQVTGEMRGDGSLNAATHSWQAGLQEPSQASAHDYSDFLDILEELKANAAMQTLPAESPSPRFAPTPQPGDATMTESPSTAHLQDLIGQILGQNDGQLLGPHGNIASLDMPVPMTMDAEAQGAASHPPSSHDLAPLQPLYCPDPSERDMSWHGGK